MRGEVVFAERLVKGQKFRFINDLPKDKHGEVAMEFIGYNDETNKLMFWKNKEIAVEDSKQRVIRL